MQFCRLTLLLLISLLFGAAPAAFPQKRIKPLRPVEVSADSAGNRPLLPLRALPSSVPFEGEDLHYTVRYGFLEAGFARLKVEEGPSYFGRKTWRVVGTGQSKGALDWVFRVRDHYESHIDRDGLFPHHFIRRVQEGGYHVDREVAFNPAGRTAATTERNTTRHHILPAYCQDLVSAFYSARSLALERLSPGDVIQIPTVIDGKVHTIRARLTTRKEIKVKAGRFDCWGFTPVVRTGRIWKNEDDLMVWISADSRRIPVLIASDLVIGSVRLELTKDASVLPHMADGQPR